MNKSSEDLKHIRTMMERSSKFLSFSGLSGVGAGMIALIGAAAAHCVMNNTFVMSGSVVADLFVVAALTFVAAGGCGLYFSMRKAKKNKALFWMPVTVQVLKDFAVPLITGGLFCLILIYHSMVLLLVPVMLIFYGLALIHAGARTYRDIRILGMCEILLGLTAAVFPGQDYDLVFWTAGFGLLHILYGIVMYMKYDRTDKVEDKG